jgi:hypothetical protein
MIDKDFELQMESNMRKPENISPLTSSHFVLSKEQEKLYKEKQEAIVEIIKAQCTLVACWHDKDGKIKIF